VPASLALACEKSPAAYIKAHLNEERMQYDATTPNQYLENLEGDWRKEKLVQVRELIQEHGSQLIEGIEYKMLSYGNSENTLFHLNAQKTYVSLYVGNIDKIENGQALLRDFDIGKGCIRIKKNDDISKSGLEEFIKKTVHLWESGADVDC